MASTSRLFSSTFASRQRAISLPSTVSSPNSNNPAASRRSMEPSHPHPLRSIHVRHAASPTPSRVSVVLPSVSGTRRPFPSWGPPPALPSSSNLRKPTPHSINTPMPSRKLYVADPKSKLDSRRRCQQAPRRRRHQGRRSPRYVARQAGKPDRGQGAETVLFRILRSQTAIVRVGWTVQAGLLPFSSFSPSTFIILSAEPT